MGSLRIINNHYETVYAYPTLRPVFKIADFFADVAELISGFLEVREALVGAEALAELPEEMKTIEDFLKFVKFIWKAKGKIQDFSEKAQKAITKAWEYITGKAIPIPPGRTVEIMNEKSLGHLNPAGIAELIGARVVNVTITKKDKELVQVQSSVDTTWFVELSWVFEAGHEAYPYAFHGGDKLPSTPWRPALASIMYNDYSKLYLVGKGKGNTCWWSALNFKHNQNTVPAVPDKHWSLPVHIPGMHPTSGVSLVSYRGRYLMAVWKDPNSRNILFSSFDKENEKWSEPSQLNNGIQTLQNPAITSGTFAYKMAVANQNPYLLSQESTGNIINQWDSQQNWLVDDRINSLTPAIFDSGYVTFYAWMRPKNNYLTIMAKSLDFTTPKKSIPEGWTSSTPAFVERGNRIYLFHKGEKSKKIAFREIIIENRQLKFGKKHDMPYALTSDGPAVCSFGLSNIFVAYKDPSEDHVVWVTYYQKGGPVSDPISPDPKYWSKPLRVG